MGAYQAQVDYAVHQDFIRHNGVDLSKPIVLRCRICLWTRASASCRILNNPEEQNKIVEDIVQEVNKFNVVLKS